MASNSGLGSGLKSFWHAMTSNDRHANHDSPYRVLSTNTHQPLNGGGGVGRNPPLQGVSSPGMETGLNSNYHEENRSTASLGGTPGVYSPRSPGGSINGPNSPYTPGMRSSVIANEAPPGGGIAMQDFGADGMPPPPPISHTWSRIDRWCEDNYPELFDQICTPATVNDINELEYSLDCSLPQDLRESLLIHDGQERGGTPTGLIFGAMLLDCEEMLDEWKNWRVVESEYLTQPPPGQKPPVGEAGSSKAESAALGRQELLGRQTSQPEGSIQKAYAHPGWIPVARDWGGNNIAVDVAPGPNGTWGQVILFGRDYDCKYVVAKSWAHFIAMVADDLQSPHWYVDEETQELKLKDPRAPRSEPGYMDILRVRNERKYGRRRFSRGPPPRPNSLPGSPRGTMSPTSFSATNGARGGLTRPAKEENALSDNHLKPPSKKPSKPLRSVAEEIPAPVAVHTKLEGELLRNNSSSNLLGDLVEEKTSATVKALEEIALSDEKSSAGDEISQPPIAVKKVEA
ncbi:hypothetical protein DFP73DRAFT_300623 [Morchella snyderi]|nr:hypothetical protein DFP73DRAFT_300623 [Morchella snyderi]